MKNKELLMELVEKYGLWNVSAEVDNLFTIVFFNRDSTWSYFCDSLDNDVYDRVTILYHALECIKKVDCYYLNDGFVTLPKFEEIEYTLIKDFLESKDSELYDKCYKKMEHYKELLINNW